MYVIKNTIYVKETYIRHKYELVNWGICFPTHFIGNMGMKR